MKILVNSLLFYGIIFDENVIFEDAFVSEESYLDYEDFVEKCRKNDEFIYENSDFLKIYWYHKLGYKFERYSEISIPEDKGKITYECKRKIAEKFLKETGIAFDVFRMSFGPEGLIIGIKDTFLRVDSGDSPIDIFKEFKKKEINFPGDQKKKTFWNSQIRDFCNVIGLKFVQPKWLLTLYCY